MMPDSTSSERLSPSRPIWTWWLLPLLRFAPSRLPLMARLSYRRELICWSVLPVLLSGMEGGTLSIFVLKTFENVPGVGTWQLQFVVGLVTAAKATGNLCSFWWASVSHGKPKIAFIVSLQLAASCMVGLIATVPPSPLGLWMVAGLVILSWMFWSGVLTLRTGVWRANYGTAHRAGVTGKISTVHALVVAACGAMIGYALDLEPQAFRVIFPLLAVAGMLGAYLYRRVPFRRHRAHVTAEQTMLTHLRPRPTPLVIHRVLAHDKAYRAYMICMFLLGTGNLMLHPVLAIALVSQFESTYRDAIAVTTIIPLVCMTLAIPFWGQLLQRMHVIRYRMYHAWSFVAVSLCVTGGVAFSQFWLLVVGSLMMGIGFGGGVLAWNLGHQHFAPPDRDAEYMSVHVTLTGIRGLIGPLLAVQIYSLTAPHGWGLLAFLICIMLNVAGAVGFALVSRSLRSEIAEAERIAMNELQETQSGFDSAKQGEPTSHGPTSLSINSQQEADKLAVPTK